MNVWIMYCEEKNQQLKNESNRFSLNFDDVIRELENGDFLVIASPGKKYETQKSFLIEINEYPIIIPFNMRKNTIQLITMFPDRRYKNANR
jgi:hypothetical protein